MARLPTQADEYGATIDQLAAAGPDLIIGVGFLYREAFLAASVRHPQLRFLLLDVALPNRPNVKSVTFRADEGSFLAGVVAAAGASGLGVIEAAREAKAEAIGVDTDQGHVAPDVVITSMRKRLDRVVETAVADVRRGSFQGGATVMNVANGGGDLVLPGGLAPATHKLVERARAAVVSGQHAACMKEETQKPAWSLPRR